MLVEVGSAERVDRGADDPLELVKIDRQVDRVELWRLYLYLDAPIMRVERLARAVVEAQPVTGQEAALDPQFVHKTPTVIEPRV